MQNETKSESLPIEHIHRHVEDNKDSLEFGTPSKVGALKVYGDFSNLDAFQQKIDNALKARSYAIVKADDGITKSSG